MAGRTRPYETDELTALARHDPEAEDAAEKGRTAGHKISRGNAAGITDRRAV